MRKQAQNYRNQESTLASKRPNYKVHKDHVYVTLVWSSHGFRLHTWCEPLLLPLTGRLIITASCALYWRGRRKWWRQRQRAAVEKCRHLNLRLCSGAVLTLKLSSHCLRVSGRPRSDPQDLWRAVQQHLGGNQECQVPQTPVSVCSWNFWGKFTLTTCLPEASQKLGPHAPRLRAPGR